MAKKKHSPGMTGITRRDFGRGTVLLLAGSAVSPATLVPAATSGQPSDGNYV